MNALIEWLDDPQVYRVNQRKAHSDHVIYGAKEEVETGNTRIQSLNGKWQFCYSRNALEPAELIPYSYFGLFKRLVSVCP